MIAGIDLGGTQVRVGLARPDGQIVSSARTRTALLGSPERLCGQHGCVEPEVVVIGGGISRSWKQVAPVFLSVLRGSPFIKPGRRLRVRRSQLGDRVGQVGAVEWARTHH